MTNIEYMDQKTSTDTFDYKGQLDETIMDICKKTGLIDNIQWYIFDEKMTDPFTGEGYSGIEKMLSDLSNGLAHPKKADVTYSYTGRRVRVSKAVIRESFVPKSTKMLEKATGKDIPSLKDRYRLAKLVISALTIFENAPGSQDERLERHCSDYFGQGATLRNRM